MYHQYKIACCRHRLESNGSAVWKIAVDIHSLGNYCTDRCILSSWYVLLTTMYESFETQHLFITRFASLQIWTIIKPDKYVSTPMHHTWSHILISRSSKLAFRFWLCQKSNNATKECLLILFLLISHSSRPLHFHTRKAWLEFAQIFISLSPVA